MKRASRSFVAGALSAAMTLTLVPGASVALAAQTSTGATEQTATATSAAQTTETQASDAAVTEVVGAINKLPSLKKATHDDNSGIKTAHEKYSKLSSAQKAQVEAQVGKAKITRFNELYSAYEAAVKVSEQIGKLPAVSKVKASDYDAIAAAAKAYDKLAQKALVSSKSSEKLADLQTAVLYTSTPALTYKVKSTNGATTTVTDSKKHTFKGGIGKVKISQPKSGVDSKTKLSASVSYSIRTHGAKTVTTSKAGTWLGSSSSEKTEQGFKLKLSGELAKHYTVYYRVKVSKLGWSDWAKSGKWAGSTGMSLRLTGLQVKFVKKGASAPGSTKNPSLVKSKLSFRANRLSGGWTGWKTSGKTAGTASWKAGIKQVQVKATGDLSGKVETSILMRKGGWTSYKTGVSGSSSKSKQAQAVRIKLTGQLSKVYNVYYRVYASDHHWLGWAKNGQKAGTQGHKYTMGAIQVQLRLKGTGAPGSTSQHFTTKAVPSYSGGELTMMRKAQQYSSGTNWLVLVNRNTTHVGVFYGSKNDWKLKKYFICDVGASSTPTPTGTRHVQYRIRSFGEEKGYSVYKATNIGGGYFFHSILYYANTMSVMDGTLGAWCSHGCIRLAYGNAKYIYDHVSNGTTVKIY